MNIAANQAIYPQTATHLPYHNGAIMQNPMQQTASMVNDEHDDDDDETRREHFSRSGFLLAPWTRRGRPIDAAVQFSRSSFQHSSARRSPPANAARGSDHV